MTKLKNLSKFNLPREKLEKYGPTKLKDFELLAILLGSGIQGKNVLSLSKSILKVINIKGFEKIALEDIQKIKGVGKTKATQIIAILELSKRFTSSKPEILSDKDVWNLCTDFRSSKKENLVAFFLDTQDRLIERQIISIGTLNASLVHPREVFEPAISLHSASIIIVHNHPSGSTEPSDADLEITKKLVDSGRILGIPVQKHLIVTTQSIQKIRV